MRRRGLALFAFALALTATAMVPTSSHAQAPTRIDAWLAGTSLTRATLPPSLRLQGMGNLTVAVDDEHNEISLLDYAGSTAGLLRDRSKGEIEMWFQNSPWNALSPSSVQLTETQTRVVSRRTGKEAIGVRIGRDATTYDAPSWPANDMRWSITNAWAFGPSSKIWVLSTKSLLDSLARESNRQKYDRDHLPLTIVEYNAKFHHDFVVALPPLTPGGKPETLTVTVPTSSDIPNPDTVYNAYRGAIDTSYAVKAGAPSGEFFYNRMFGKKVSLGTRLGFRHDSEHGSRAINYHREYSTSAWTPGLSLAVEPLRGLTVGGVLDYDDAKIEGVSNGLNVRAKSSHYDTFRQFYSTWHRAANAFVDLGKWGRAGYVWDRSTGEGNQTFHTNWGDQDALLRSGGSIEHRGTLFEDSHRITTNKARASLHPVAALTLAGSYAHVVSNSARHIGSGSYVLFNETRWVNVDSIIGEYYFGSTSDDNTRNATTLGGSWNIRDKVTLAAEYLHDTQDMSSSLRGVATPHSSTVNGVSGGLEMKLSSDLAVRSGYQHSKVDETQDRWRRLTAGTSFHLTPLWTVDGVFALANYSRPASADLSAIPSTWTRSLALFSRLQL